MRTILFICLLSSFIGYSQVGINTSDPKGALEIQSDNLGLVLPRVTSLENVTNNDSGLAEDGTVVYDVSRNEICLRIVGKWFCIASDAYIQETTVIPNTLTGGSPSDVDNDFLEQETQIDKPQNKKL